MPRPWTSAPNALGRPAALCRSTIQGRTNTLGRSPPRKGRLLGQERRHRTRVAAVYTDPSPARLVASTQTRACLRASLRLEDEPARESERTTPWHPAAA